MVCSWPGSSETAALRILLASTQIIRRHSSFPRSDRDAAACCHGFQTTMVAEFSFSVGMVRCNEGSISETGPWALRYALPVGAETKPVEYDPPFFSYAGLRLAWKK